MVRKVYKYGTGHPIPDGAVYLCTKVETLKYAADNGLEKAERVRNELVWHYFLVEVEE